MDARKGGSNFDPDKVTRFVAEIERHIGTLETYKGEHMSRCRNVRDNISQVYDLAADAGVPKKELKRVVKVRGLERKLEKAITFEEAENQDTFDAIRLALGDLSELPLGAAPLAAAPDAPAGVDPNKEAAERNAEALRKGIKQMPPKPANGDAAKAANDAPGEDFSEDIRPRHMRPENQEPAPKGSPKH